MASESRPAKSSIPSSGEGTSEPTEAQLSPPGRVHSDVSSIAMDRGLLAVGGGVSRPQAGAEAAARSDGLSDAEVMLRVKAGDEPAFEYLVQKYRRPMMGFMYRMARNSAAAEDLAQEVFLR